jgi:hypothetical protein
LLGREGLIEQGGRGRFAPLRAHRDHFAVDNVRQHRPELLALAAVNLVEPEVARSPLRPLRVPPPQERVFGAARRAPAHAMPHRGVTGRHRLAIEPNQLLQSAGHPGLGIGKLDALGPDAAVPTPHPPLRVHDVAGWAAQSRSWQVRSC